MGVLDNCVVGLYFLAVFLVAFFVTRKERKEKNSSNYFLGGQSATWFVIGASLFASNIGSEHLIGLSGAGARGNFIEGQFELLAAIILLLLGWFFVPYYMRSGVYTMPEFLEKRFSKSARNYLSVVSIVAYVLTKISATIFAGAVVFDTLLNVDFWVGAGLVVVFTGIYTIFGGLKAVVYTDLVQMFVLTAGSLALIYFGLDALGGWDVMVEKIESKGGAAKGNYLNLWNQDVANGGYPWTGVIFGAPILGVWYWCTDQFIVQRVLAAKDQSHARKGTIFAGFLKILPIFLFVLPGVIAFALHQQTGDLLPLKDGKLSHEAALPSLVVQYLPAGMKGLVAAGLLAALMSSLSSVFNSCSTLITFDFFKVRNPEANEKTLVRFGQWSTVALVIVGLFWIPIMASLIEDDGLFKYLQSIQAYISPPIAAAFVLGLLWKRLNAKGAMWTLWSGFILGMARFVLYIMTDKGATLKASMEADPGKSWYLGPIEWFTSMNFLHFALFLFIFCALVLIVVSYATKEDQNIDFDFGFKSAIANTNRGPIVLDAVLSGVLIIAVVIIWFIFSPIGIA